MVYCFQHFLTQCVIYILKQYNLKKPKTQNELIPTRFIIRNLSAAFHETSGGFFFFFYHRIPLNRPTQHVLVFLFKLGSNKQ